MRFFHGTNIDFIGKRNLFFLISALAFLITVIGAFYYKIEYGIDFVGGTEVAIKFYDDIHTDKIRNSIDKAGLTGSEIKSFGEDNQFLIRIKKSGNVQEMVTNALTNDFPNQKFDIIKVDKIGPKVGAELRNQAFIAIILSIIAMLIYLAFRFEFLFGLGAIIALTHDVAITFCAIIILNKITGINLEFNQSILAALLTVVGYSVNDTVIIFDRIRENREIHKGMALVKLFNLSVNETLSRTVNTVTTVLITLVVMTIFGGPVIQGFAFTMALGIIFGTYSSVYVASSFVIWYLQKVKKVDVEGAMSKKEAAALLKT